MWVYVAVSRSDFYVFLRGSRVTRSRVAAKPDLAERYVIDSAEAAVGVATDLLREEFGAAVFKAQATVLLDRLRYCMPGHEEAEVRRHTQRKQWLSREAHASCRGRAMARFRYPRP